MTRKLLMAAAVAVAIALTPSIGIGTAEADSGGFHGGGFPGGGFHGGGFHGGGFHHRAFSGERRFRGTGLGYGFIGYTEPAPAAEAPSVFAVPQPASTVLAVDRPPCRETTTVGVVIERGQSCSRSAQ